jgi:hypothetical protein
MFERDLVEKYDKPFGADTIGQWPVFSSRKVQVGSSRIAATSSESPNELAM